uniref:LisH domain-containing protein ARMC9 n=1 Tax=Strigamia maritima TaxID=126957 RepID=T1J4C4_STRMM
MESEVELDWIVREVVSSKQYLELTGHVETLKVFDAETKKRNPADDKHDDRPNVIDQIHKKKVELLGLFENGQRQKFLEVWDKSIPLEMREKNEKCRNLEFYLHIHFSVLPLRSSFCDNGDLQERMGHFKTFLETRGSQLSQTPEFLPFYALPFIPHPKNHPSFQELFKDSWIKELRDKLDIFLSKTLKCSLQSRLSQLLTTEKSMQQQSQQVFNHVAELSQRLFASQQHAKKIQEDYQKLIGLSAELIGSLELAVQGELNDVDPIINLCARSFPEIFGGNTTNCITSQLNVQPLNMDKIRTDLSSGHPRTVALLLQALRWRVTKCKHWGQQVAILVSYIAADLLGCTHAGNFRVLSAKSEKYKTVLSFITSQIQEICQSVSRFFNLFACFREGRVYLAQYSELICVLVDNLLYRKLDNITLDMTLATLQKLSLRRNHQLIMIDRGMVEWLIGILEDHESLTDYSLEYAVALFMNLCLRMSGKNRCASNPHRVLKMLTDLLGNQNQEIVPYVNGALYSVLYVESVRKEARAMAMEDILRCFIQEGNSEMRRQLEFILKQLMTDSSTQLESDDDNKDEDEDDDDDDDEEELISTNQPGLEVDIDRDDCVQAGANELCGEQFLMQRYLLFPNSDNSTAIKKSRGNSANATEVLTSPVTPRPMIMKHQEESKDENLSNDPKEPLHESDTRTKVRKKNTKTHAQPKKVVLQSSENQKPAPEVATAATSSKQGEDPPIKLEEKSEPVLTSVTNATPNKPVPHYQLRDYLFERMNMQWRSIHDPKFHVLRIPVLEILDENLI